MTHGMDPGELTSAGPAAFSVMRAHLYVPRGRRRWRMLRTLIMRLNILSHWAWRTAGRARQRGLFNRHTAMETPFRREGVGMSWGSIRPNAPVGRGYNARQPYL